MVHEEINVFDSKRKDSGKLTLKIKNYIKQIIFLKTARVILTFIQPKTEKKMLSRLHWTLQVELDEIKAPLGKVSNPAKACLSLYVWVCVSQSVTKNLQIKLFDPFKQIPDWLVSTRGRGERGGKRTDGRWGGNVEIFKTREEYQYNQLLLIWLEPSSNF